MLNGSRKIPLIRYVTDEWQQLPIVVKRFSIRAIALLLFWYIGYRCIIKPDARIDSSLTKVTTQAITYSLNKYYKEGFSMTPQMDSSNQHSFSQIIYYQNSYALLISHPCNGLNLFLLYLGFLFCVPGSIIKKSIFSIVGLVFIFILNIFRCCALAWLNLNKPEWTEFAHHYAFTAIVYVFIFLFWVMFLYESEQHEI